MAIVFVSGDDYFEDVVMGMGIVKGETILSSYMETFALRKYKFLPSGYT
jgi:hypothetical protein